MASTLLSNLLLVVMIFTLRAMAANLIVVASYQLATIFKPTFLHSNGDIMGRRQYAQSAAYLARAYLASS